MENNMPDNILKYGTRGRPASRTRPETSAEADIHSPVLKRQVWLLELQMVAAAAWRAAASSAACRHTGNHEFDHCRARGTAARPLRSG